MPINAEVLKELNDETKTFRSHRKRGPELAVELNQLRTAAEAALTVHDFHRDPGDFHAVPFAPTALD